MKASITFTVDFEDPTPGVDGDELEYAAQRLAEVIGYASWEDIKKLTIVEEQKPKAKPKPKRKKK